jgi:hypothetical protein
MTSVPLVTAITGIPRRVPDISVPEIFSGERDSSKRSLKLIS